MMNLREIEEALDRATSNEQRDEIRAELRRLGDEIRVIKLEATLALEKPYADLRPAILLYIHNMARVHGRTPAEQVRAWTDDGDPWFQKLALAAWGISFDA